MVKKEMNGVFDFMKNDKKNVAVVPLSLRGKKRYILFRLDLGSFSGLSNRDFDWGLRNHLLYCFGVLGLPLHRVSLIEFNPESGFGILRCAHTSKDSIITALNALELLNGKKARIFSLKTSGSLQKLRSFKP